MRGAIRKDAKIYSRATITEAMNEARTVLYDSVEKVWADDKYIREVAEGVIKEYEYVFRRVLGNG